MTDPASIVDDSATVRQVLPAALADDPGIEVVGTAADPPFALDRMARGWPDVIVLDVEMPRMDGISFLKKLMAERPTPVVICSTLTEKGTETTMQALAAGAVSVVTKPKAGLRQFLLDHTQDLAQAVKAAARANMASLAGRMRMPPPAPKLSADAILPSASQAMTQTTETVVAIGTSTGGAQALEFVLSCPGRPGSARASSSSSTCPRCSPAPLPNGSMVCAGSKYWKPRTATVWFRAEP